MKESYDPVCRNKSQGCASLCQTSCSDGTNLSGAGELIYFSSGTNTSHRIQNSYLTFLIHGVLSYHVVLSHTQVSLVFIGAISDWIKFRILTLFWVHIRGIRISKYLVDKTDTEYRTHMVIQLWVSTAYISYHIDFYKSDFYIFIHIYMYTLLEYKEPFYTFKRSSFCI